MIQRIQSIYLLLVISLSSSLGFIFLQPENEMVLTSFYTSYRLFWSVPILSLIALLLFKRRKLQALVCVMLLLVNLIPVIVYGQKSLNESEIITYYVVIALSLLNFILVYISRRAILKDEKLVRSVDRIR